MNRVLCNRRQLAHFFQSRKTLTEIFFCHCWRNIFGLLQTPSLKLVPLFMDCHQDDMPPVDYICVPASCLRTVARCYVQYKAADRLQIICDSARRDHVSIQMEISLRLEYVGNAKKVEQQ